MNSYLDRLQQELEDAIGNASSNELSQAPAGKWSPTQILEHLLLTYRNTTRGLEKCRKQGNPLARSVTLKDRVAALLVVNLGYIPNGRQAPERALPRGVPPDEVRQQLMPELRKMALALDEREKEFGARTKILDHPFLGPLTASEWAKFHWVHGRHHARQIRQRLRKA